MNNKAGILFGSFGGLIAGVNSTLILFGHDRLSVLAPAMGVVAGISIVCLALRKFS